MYTRTDSPSTRAADPETSFERYAAALQVDAVGSRSGRLLFVTPGVALDQRHEHRDLLRGERRDRTCHLIPSSFVRAQVSGVEVYSGLLCHAGRSSGSRSSSHIVNASLSEGMLESDRKVCRFARRW